MVGAFVAVTVLLSVVKASVVVGRTVGMSSSGSRHVIMTFSVWPQFSGRVGQFRKSEVPDEQSTLSIKKGISSSDQTASMLKLVSNSILVVPKRL